MKTTNRRNLTRNVGDYARTTLIDPVNLVGFGIGKLFTGAGSKSAAKLGQLLQ